MDIEKQEAEIKKEGFTVNGYIHRVAIKKTAFPKYKKGEVQTLKILSLHGIASPLSFFWTSL